MVGRLQASAAADNDEYLVQDLLVTRDSSDIRDALTDYFMSDAGANMGCGGS